MLKQSRGTSSYFMFIFGHITDVYIYIHVRRMKDQKNISLDSETETGDRHEDVKIELEKNEGTMQIQIFG